MSSRGMSSYDSITVSSAWELTSVSMRYSQGDEVNTFRSRITYCTHVLVFHVSGLQVLFSCVLFLYVNGYVPWHGHVLPRAPVIKIMRVNQIPAGINCPPPSKTISPITWFGTISTAAKTIEVPRDLF